VWIVGHHPDWGPSLAEFFEQRLAAASTLDESSQNQTVELLGILSRATEIQTLLVRHLSGPAAARTLALRAMAQAGLATTPTAWLDAMASLLPEADAVTAPMAVAACRQWTLPKGGHPALAAALLRTAEQDSLPVQVRLDALTTAGPRQPLTPALFDLLLMSLHPEQAMSDRTAAADILGNAGLTAQQRQTLLNSMRQVGPLELPRLLPAFARDQDEPVGLQLVSVLQESEGLRGLRTDLIKPLLAQYPESVQAAGRPLLTALNAGAEQQAAHLEQLLTDLPQGDIHRGHEVFMGKKAACINCHKLGYGGGRLGPDLSNIGKVRNRRDLLEAIIYPSISIVRGYEPVIAELADGRTVAGIVISESRDEIVIGVDAVKTSHIARADIEQVHPSPQSPMPNGLATLLTTQELADLMAFLQNLK
jgi:putative heme-binding domain-containing protein